MHRLRQTDCANVRKSPSRSLSNRWTVDAYDALIVVNYDVSDKFEVDMSQMVSQRLLPSHVLCRAIPSGLWRHDNDACIKVDKSRIQVHIVSTSAFPSVRRSSSPSILFSFDPPFSLAVHSV